MGVILSFISTRAVAPEAESALRQESEQPSGPQPWVLCEPPHFYPREPDGRLWGGSKLNLHPHQDELEEASSVPAERNDLQELLHRLCDWSVRYDLVWELELEGMPLGRIAQGECDANVEGTLQAFADVGQFLAEEYPDGLHEEADEADEEAPEELPPPPAGPRPQLRIWREHEADEETTP